MRRFLLPLILIAGLLSLTHADPLRLIDIVPNPGVADGEISFGRSLDWDDTEILVGAYPSVHVFDSQTREHKYQLGENVTLVDGFAFGSKVVMTPNHFLTVSTRVNRQQTLYVFRRSDGGLERTIPTPSGSVQEPGFGSAFALKDNRLFVSILGNTPVGGTTAIGGVYVYDIRDWSMEPQMFRPSDGERFDGFGNSIAVEGNILAVGANRKGSDFQGAVYLFDATSRALIAKITGAVADGWYGTSVLLRNGKLYVTSRSSVWEYDAATGNYLGKFSPVPAAGYYDWFGSDVEVVGSDMLAVWSDKTLYQFDLGTRQQIAALRNPLDTGTLSTLAGEMKARGDILLTGAAGGTDPGTSKGALLAFTKLAAEPVVEVSDATGSEAQRRVTVTFRVNPPASKEVTVNFETRQDSAREGMDFIARSGSVTIPAGQATATLDLAVVDDAGSEPTERFFLDLLGGSGAIVPPTQVELWITDNDAAISRSIGTNVGVPLPSFAGDKLGGTIAAFGSSAFVGSLDLDGSGLLRGGVFAVDLQTRQVKATIKPTGFVDGARFGQGLAVDEGLLAVGANKSRANPAVPAIYLYDRETLAERMVLVPPSADSIGFGTKIALGASHILVGLPFEDRRGYQVGDVLVYDRATGVFLSRIESPTGVLGGQFGVSVTVSGTHAVIGTNGRVYCFDLKDNNRLIFEVERDTRDTSHITSDFGEYVQANENYIVVGNPWDDSFKDNSGSVMIFDAATGAHINTIRTRFEVANSNFGNSVSLMGRVLAVTGGNAGVDLVDIPTGHELLHFAIPSSFVSYGYLQNVILTNTHVVIGAPWGRGIDVGRVMSFRRDGLELGGLAILANSSSAAEGNSGATNFTFTVSRTGSTVGSVDAIYTVGGKAVSAADFGGVFPTGTVTIADGATSAIVTIPVSADLLVEPNETFIVTLSAAGDNVISGAVASTTATIIDDDTATVGIAKITDGVEAAIPTNALFRVIQTAPASVDTVISYTVGGTASPGTDFTALSGSVTIQAGQTTADISVAVLDEHIVGRNETVSITLNGFSAGDPEVTLGASSTAFATIMDDDTATVSLAKITDGIEAAIPTHALFRVTQTAPASVDTVVSYTVGGTASSGTDFTALSGSVTIQAGQTTADIGVAVLDEHVVEPTETVSITMTGFSARDPEVTLGASLTASATIADNIAGVITLKTVQPIEKNIKINRGTGLFDVVVKVTNTSPYSVNGFRVHVDFSGYKAAYPSLSLHNASSPPKSKNVYVDYRNPVAVNDTVSLTLSFYTHDRKFPKRFEPICTAEGLRSPVSLIGRVGSSKSRSGSTSGVSGVPLAALSILPATPATPRIAVMPDRRVRLEFPATPGRWYRVSYTSDLIRWIDCLSPEQATGTTLYWTDSGPPVTDTHPAGEPSRFYRIREVTAP
ncbi:MAG: Calx-beta domain-containing protein [Verrucomicrobiota bacterium]